MDDLFVGSVCIGQVEQECRYQHSSCIGRNSHDIYNVMCEDQFEQGVLFGHPAVSITVTFFP